ncbi:thiamine-phosphate kinase [Patescibacteria group bacterium]
MKKVNNREKSLNLSDIGEFGLIKLLVDKIQPSKMLDGGIGDDVAIVKHSANKWLLLTTDSLIEDSHFKKNWFKPFSLGKKAAAINLSDISSKGGTPKYALISLGLPFDLKTSFVDKLYDGLISEFSKAKVQIVGGNITRSTKILIDIFLVGEIKPKMAVLRSTAKIGDLVLHTGFLGEARAGFKILEKGLQKESSLLERFLKPKPRLKEGQILAERKLVSSMMDISDGLWQDLGMLCQASSVGVELWQNKIFLSEKLKKAGKILNMDPLKLALQGGEDYELLFTCKKKNADKIKKMLKSKTNIKVSIIGKIKPLSYGRKIVNKDRKQSEIFIKGWDHFKK